MNEAADRIEELEAKLTAKACPLGDECDLTVAYMAGVEKAKDTIRQQQRIKELEKQVLKAEQMLEREIRRVQKIRADLQPPHKVDLLYVEEEYRNMLDELKGDASE